MNDNIEGFATNLMNFYNLAVDAIEIVVCVQWLVVLIGPTTLLVISPSVCKYKNIQVTPVSFD